MQSENEWIVPLQEAVVQALEQCFDITWGRDIQNNWGFAIDLDAIVNSKVNEPLHIQNRSVNANGIEISATVDAAVDSLAEITHAVYGLLGRVAEGFLVVMPMHNDGALTYWFVTGSVTHGHRGIVMIKRESIVFTSSE